MSLGFKSLIKLPNISKLNVGNVNNIFYESITLKHIANNLLIISQLSLLIFLRILSN